MIVRHVLRAALTPILSVIAQSLESARTRPHGPRKDWYVGGAREPTFLHDDPEVMQMTIVEHGCQILAIPTVRRSFEKTEL